mmetsp:Transcript_18376/g.48508  ORF Transcript_18376/g.48508 Transcript_18376/m.48508 type:complete len:603 (+) Transcript_18376:128-1936(+)
MARTFGLRARRAAAAALAALLASDGASARLLTAASTPNHAKPLMDSINAMRAELCWTRPDLWSHQECMDFLGLHCAESSTGHGICTKFTDGVKELCAEEWREDGGSGRYCKVATVLGIPIEQVPVDVVAVAERPEGSKDSSGHLLPKAHKRPTIGAPAPAALAPAPAAASRAYAPSAAPLGIPVDGQEQDDFADLTSCQVAYTKLADRCDASDGSSHAPREQPCHQVRHVSAPGEKLRPGEDLGENGPLPRESPFTLVHDAEGNTITNTATIRNLEDNGRVLYKAPDANGIPSTEKGFDYLGHGDDWGDLGQCGSSSFDQSPIDLPRFIGVRGQTKSVLWFDYYVDPDLTAETKAKLVNDGHGLKYQVRPNSVDLGFLKLGGTEYVASEYIFHGPSEHSVDGAVFPLELQIYNKQKTGKGMVAISIFFKEGNSNPFIDALRQSMGDEAPIWSVARGPGAGFVNGTFEKAFDLESLLPKGNPAKESTFFNYKGSLTQPPCTTGVDWWVLVQPVDASREEIRFIRRAIFGARSTRHGNARASMPIGNRTLSVGLVGYQNAVKIHQDYPPWKDHDAVKQPRGYNSEDVPWGSHWHPGDSEEPPVL